MCGREPRGRGRGQRGGSGGLPLHVLHDEIVEVLALSNVHPGVVSRHDIGVANGLPDLHFAEEALREIFCSRKVGVDELERHLMFARAL